MGGFSGRVAIVTGGSGGIGAAVAHDLSHSGAHVVVLGRNDDAGRQVVDAINDSGGSSEFVSADVSESASVDDAVNAVVTRLGRCDIAVNSAGIFDRMHPFGSYADAQWDEIINVNLSGVFRCLRAELRVMAGTGGAIVNIGSTVAHRGSERASPAYVAAKHAVLGLTRQAALETPQSGVRVNSVSPGPTDTAMAAPLIAEGPEAVRAAIAPLNPMGDFIDPARVAAAVHFLCSDAAADITGHDLILDGGQLARL